MREPILTLRNRKTQTKEFRDAAHDIAAILAKDVVRRPAFQGQSLMRHSPRTVLGKRVVLVPVLRAGFALLSAFMSAFPSARVGLIGLKRDEKTLRTKKYYQNIPKISKSDRVVVLDPMLATSGSAVATIRELVKSGAREENILFAGVISAPEGLANLKKHFPRVDTVIAIHDKKLNKHGYIVPGLGDFGDRYFGG